MFDGEVKGLQIVNPLGMTSVELVLAFNVLEGLMPGVENEFISH